MSFSNRPIAVALLLLSIVLLGASLYPAEYGADDEDRKDCPGPWLSFDYQGIYTEMKVAGPTSKIPEFHDCQRFIAADGTYEHLYAVFASFKLDTILDTLRRKQIVAFVAAAEIITKTGGYDALGIKRGFNCLYVSSIDWTTAYMINLDYKEQDCHEVHPNPTGGRRLNVHRTTIPGYLEPDYPAVARWHQASATGEMQIMFKCDDGWCEVGGPPRAPTTVNIPPSQATLLNRVQHIPLWYDEQSLAVPKISSDPPGLFPNLPVKPSRVRGIVRPSPLLGNWTKPEDFSNGRRVGTIWLSDASPHYRQKLNLRQGDNAVRLQSSRRYPLWWLWRFNAFIGDPTQPPVVQRRKVDWWTHEGITIPATSRWRWLANDETIWERCPEGCCQVQGGGS